MSIKGDALIDEAIDEYKKKEIPQKAWLNRFRYDFEKKWEFLQDSV